jgi:hypothetical protein
MKYLLPILLCAAACTSTVSETATLELKVQAVGYGGKEVPLHTVMSLPEGFSHTPIEEIDVEIAEGVPGQVVRGKGGMVELWWIDPKLSSGEEQVLTADMKRGKNEGFEWHTKARKHDDLLLDGRKVLRYMCAFDPSTPERLLETYKPFHHVFDAAGEAYITKGPGGLYTHHRGLFIGWNRLTFEEKEYDFWHMKGVNQVHMEVLDKEAGPVLGRSRTVVHWNLAPDDPVIIEEREVTVYRQSPPALLLLDFKSTLKAVKGDVFLNGDPEHAGFQFRATNYVAEGPAEDKAVYLFHADGIDPKKDKDLPWVAMRFGLNGKYYVVQHMNHPDNPEGTVYSAYRDYGRFGAFPAVEVKAQEPLTLRYRVYVMEGEMPARKAMAERYSAYTKTPEVVIQ